MNTVHYLVRDAVAVVVLDHPPVNALGHALREGILTTLERANADPAVKAVVIIGSGNAFCGGADIKELGTPLYSRELTVRSMKVPDTVNKPMVAAIAGFALGGGLELAMCCHYRVALRGVRLALPEVKLGRCAGSGGTQRLPRLIGVAQAANMLLSGDAISSERGRELGLIDELIEGDLLEGALRYAHGLIAQGRGPRRTRDVAVILDNPQQFFSKKRAELERTMRGFAAPFKILECLEAAMSLPFDEGKAVEDRCSHELRGSPQDQALRHLFLAERLAGKIPDLPADTAVRDLRLAAVIGAGATGGGIAMCFADAGMPVQIIDTGPEVLDQCLAVIRANYLSEVVRGVIAQAQMDRRLALISTAAELSAAAGADVIVEATAGEIESMRSIFGELGRIAKPRAMLAVNTSGLNVTRIAAATTRPQDVIGAHFRAPDYTLRLLEVVRGENTSAEVLATVMKLGKRLGKVAVVSGVADGCIGSRMLASCRAQTMALLEEGVTPPQIERALGNWGFAMDAFAIRDLAGDEGRAHVTNHRGNSGRVQRAISDEEIVERFVFAMANEGARLLEEKIALRASDLDVVFALGYGFPRYRGGAMFHADAVGLANVLASIERFARGHRGNLWAPAPLLARLAAEGKTFNPA